MFQLLEIFAQNLIVSAILKPNNYLIDVLRNT